MTRSTARPASLAGALIAAALVLAGCSDDGSHGGTHAGSPADVNETDIAFAQGMIVHHEGALEMAQLADDRAEDPRVLDLAGRIEAAQEPEIETMTGWLEEWGEPTSAEGDHSTDGMDHGSGDMGMSEEDMSALEDASGAEFDRMWLELMTEHHEGAVEMSETEIAEGRNADAVALAEDIVESQSTEIEEMATLLGELGG